MRTNYPIDIKPMALKRNFHKLSLYAKHKCDTCPVPPAFAINT